VTRVEIDFVSDGVVHTDTVTAEQVSAGIISDSGRGYVCTPAEDRVYRRIERIVVSREEGAR
jgi:hypothetical protein